MNIVTGCSGIDAIAYAAMLLDIEVVGQIEIDDFCNQILELRFPGVKRYKDVFDVRGDEFGTVDIFAFGDPCQPHSVAGKRQGTADDRFIWPELLRIIQTMRPAWILNENVIGSVSNGVVRDKILQLESEGYRARAYTVPACAVGTPHERERVFIVAHTGSRGCDREPRRGTGTEPADGYSGIEALANTEGKFLYGGRYSWGRRGGLADSSTIMANTSSIRCESYRELATGERVGQKEERTYITESSSWSAQSGLGGNADGLPGRLHEPGGQEDGGGVFTAFEAIFTATLGQILWPAGYGAEQYNYEPPRVATGIKHRVNRLKVLGNSIVWQQIFPFLLAIKLLSAPVMTMTDRRVGAD